MEKRCGNCNHWQFEYAESSGGQTTYMGRCHQVEHLMGMDLGGAPKTPDNERCKDWQLIEANSGYAWARTMYCTLSHHASAWTMR